jgi:hypothetical protein
LKDHDYVRVRDPWKKPSSYMQNHADYASTQVIKDSLDGGIAAKLSIACYFAGEPHLHEIKILKSQ